MPKQAKMGFALWLMSWIWLLINYYVMTEDIAWIYKLSAGIGFLAIFISQAQNWARFIAVLANSMGILLSGYFFLAGFVVVAAVNVAFFGGAIFFLMSPSTAAYFKSQSRPANPSNDK